MASLARPTPYRLAANANGLIPILAADGTDVCFVPSNGDDEAARATAEKIVALARIEHDRRTMTVREIRRALNDSAAL